MEIFEEICLQVLLQIVRELLNLLKSYLSIINGFNLFLARQSYF